MAREDSPSRLIRLLRLATEVRTHPSQTPEQLQRALAISESQYFRDKEALLEMGFQYKWDRTKRRHVVEKDIFLPVMQLELTELFALAAAVRQLSASGDYALSFGALNALKKIGAGADSHLLPVVRAVIDDMVLEEGFGCDVNVLETLQECREREREVIITYRGKSTGWQEERIHVDPYCLYFRRRAIYLDGWSHNANEIRTFRVNRISRAEPVARYFKVREVYDAHQRHRSAWEVFSGDSVERVTILFDRETAPYIAESRFHRTQHTERRDDGSLLFTVEVAEPREVAWWARRWGAGAEVMEPAWLRDEEREECEKVLRKYGPEKEE